MNDEYYRSIDKTKCEFSDDMGGYWLYQAGVDTIGRYCQWRVWKNWVSGDLYFDGLDISGSGWPEVLPKWWTIA